MLYPERIRKNLISAGRVAGITSLALAPRIAMLLTVERRLDADESVVGLMAKHIIDGQGVPLFFYGQHYGGGHVIEALATAAIFKLAGISSLAVQLIPALFSVGVVLIIYLYMSHAYGRRTAFWAAMLLSYSTPFLKSSLKADGYIETIFLYTLAFYMLHLLREGLFDPGGEPRKKIDEWAAFRRSIVLAGALGAAWWSYDFSLIATLTAALLILRMRIIRSLPHAIILILAFAAAASPVIYDNLHNDFANIRHLIGGVPHASGGTLAIATGAAKKLFTIQIPAFLTRDCVHFFVYPPPLEAWAYYGVAIFSAATIIAARRRIKFPSALALFPLLYLLFYCLSGFSGARQAQTAEELGLAVSAWSLGMSPRYLLPLEPPLSAAIAAAIGYLIASKRPTPRFLGYLAVPVITAAIIAGCFSIFQDKTIVEGNVRTNPESIPKIVEFLKTRKITCVDTSYFVKWRILFESREQINAMDIEISSGRKISEYDLYERLGCPKDKAPTYVFNAKSPYLYAASAKIANGPWRYMQWRTDDHIVLFPGGKKKD